MACTYTLEFDYSMYSNEKFSFTPTAANFLPTEYPAANKAQNSKDFLESDAGMFTLKGLLIISIS